MKKKTALLLSGFALMLAAAAAPRPASAAFDAYLNLGHPTAATVVDESVAQSTVNLILWTVILH
jgi:hypothetical protein